MNEHTCAERSLALRLSAIFDWGEIDRAIICWRLECADTKALPGAHSGYRALSALMVLGAMLTIGILSQSAMLSALGGAALILTAVYRGVDLSNQLGYALRSSCAHRAFEALLVSAIDKDTIKNPVRSEPIALVRAVLRQDRKLDVWKALDAYFYLLGLSEQAPAAPTGYRSQAHPPSQQAAPVEHLDAGAYTSAAEQARGVCGHFAAHLTP